MEVELRIVYVPLETAAQIAAWQAALQMVAGLIDQPAEGEGEKHDESDHHPGRLAR